MSGGGKTVVVSGYLPDAFHADGTLKDEHRCPRCPAPGEGVPIDLGNLGELGGVTIDLSELGSLGALGRLLAAPPPPPRGRWRGKRRRKRR